MDVALIVIITVVIFIVLDLALRLLVQNLRRARVKKERKLALDTGLKLDVSKEATSLKRVEVDKPKARILAVDDEEVILDGFRKMLVLAGYSVDTVEKGSEVLSLIKEHDYDFVFTDLKMPGLDGIEVTKAVRHLRPDIDVIVITGYGSIETAVETVRLGAMDYVQKPFTEDELLEFVKTAVFRRNDRLNKQMRHKIRLIKPGISESNSRFELNVPAGVFVSPQHVWAKIELNGNVRIGIDDLIRKVFSKIDQVELPDAGQNIERGETLFTLVYGNFRLAIPSPISGTINTVNLEHSEHPEWLSIKPFELSWVCGIEPSNLAEELAGLKIGIDSVKWYQQEMDRFSELSDRMMVDASLSESEQRETGEKNGGKDGLELLARYTEPFLQA